MRIVLLVNDASIDEITVYNRGPSGGEYIHPDGPGGMGERVYEWHVNHRYGFVLHKRRDGARALAAAVLSAAK